MEGWVVVVEGGGEEGSGGVMGACFVLGGGGMVVFVVIVVVLLMWRDRNVDLMGLVSTTVMTMVGIVRIVIVIGSMWTCGVTFSRVIFRVVVMRIIFVFFLNNLRG